MVDLQPESNFPNKQYGVLVGNELHSLRYDRPGDVGQAGGAPAHL
jgi:hypothetical protein